MKSLAICLVVCPLVLQFPTAALSQAQQGAAPSALPKKQALTAEQKAAKSKACSAEADKKGLHGKARKKFRSECKRQ